MMYDILHFNYKMILLLKYKKKGPVVQIKLLRCSLFLYYGARGLVAFERVCELSQKKRKVVSISYQIIESLVARYLPP